MSEHQSVRPATLARWSLGILLGTGRCGIAAAACVNKAGFGGCYTTISAAVAAASPNDTINVGPGSYHESVVIPIPLSLIGAGAQRTIIDATDLPNGIHVDGFEHPGLEQVNVSGFTVRNANFQGILVSNASFVSVAGNRIIGNNTHLVPSTEPPSCPGLESFLGGVFVDGEGFDCGEGIHLSAVARSIVTDNLVQGNAGGILLSDDTGGAAPVTGTLIAKNQIKQEGIDLAVKTPGMVSAHFNNLLDGIGVSNLGTGPVDATENWWSGTAGPGAPGCGTVASSNVSTSPWLKRPSTPLL